MKKNNWYGDAVLSKIQARMKIGLNLVGEFLSGVARALAPVDTGYLRGSVYYNVIGPYLLRIGDKALYAIYVEFGTGEKAENGQGRKGGWFYTDAKGVGHFTRGQRPQPFIRPLLTGYEKDIMIILASVGVT